MDGREKVFVITGMLGIDIVLQTLTSLAAAAASGASLPIGPLFLAVGLVSALHGLAIGVCVLVAGRQYARLAARR